MASARSASIRKRRPTFSSKRQRKPGFSARSMPTTCAQSMQSYPAHKLALRAVTSSFPSARIAASFKGIPPKIPAPCKCEPSSAHTEQSSMHANRTRVRLPCKHSHHVHVMELPAYRLHIPPLQRFRGSPFRARSANFCEIHTIWTLLPSRMSQSQRKR